MNLSRCVTCPNNRTTGQPSLTTQPNHARHLCKSEVSQKRNNTRTGQNKANASPFKFAGDHVVAVGPTRLAARLPSSTHHHPRNLHTLSFQHTLHKSIALNSHEGASRVSRNQIGPLDSSEKGETASSQFSLCWDEKWIAPWDKERNTDPPRDSQPDWTAGKWIPDIPSPAKLRLHSKATPFPDCASCRLPQAPCSHTTHSPLAAA